MSGETYYLNRERMRVVQKNERGVVRYRKRYVFGDEVDTSRLVEGRLEALVESGALVTSEDDLRRRSDGAVPRPGSRVTGAATGEAEDHSDLAVDEPDEDGGGGGGTPDDDDNDDDNVEMVDDYSSMDYSELQEASKAKGIHANQSADALRDALRNS